MCSGVYFSKNFSTRVPSSVKLKFNNRHRFLSVLVPVLVPVHVCDGTKCGTCTVDLMLAMEPTNCILTSVLSAIVMWDVRVLCWGGK